MASTHGVRNWLGLRFYLAIAALVCRLWDDPDPVTNGMAGLLWPILLVGCVVFLPLLALAEFVSWLGKRRD